MYHSLKSSSKKEQNQYLSNLLLYKTWWHLCDVWKNRMLCHVAVQGSRKEIRTIRRESETGSRSRSLTGRDREEGHRDISLEPRGRSDGLICFSTLGALMMRGLTCDTLSWKIKTRLNNRGDCCTVSECASSSFLQVKT